MKQEKVRIPPALKKGDLIGIMCPSGHMPSERAAECIRVLQSEWGYRVRVGQTLGQEWHYFSGTDEARRDELQEMLDDPEIKAILFARGGYGMGRIMDQLDFSRFRRAPKWLIGFSDITLLHAQVLRRCGIATLHAPMAAAFREDGYKNEYVQSLRHALHGRKGHYSASPHPFNQQGSGEGLLVGGNLSLVTHLIGSRSAYQTKGRILFLEDVGEHLYHLDRMMRQLLRAGMLTDLAGLVLGGFTELKDTERPFGKTIDEILHDITKSLPYPVCFGFPVSHEKENYALKVGALYKLRVTARSVTLREA